MRKFYLYKITNKINQKVYIGMTCRPETRFKEHCSPYSTCTKLRNSIQKHGVDNFEYEILCIGTEEYILDLEEKAIIAHDSIDSGYNLVLGNPKTGAILLSEEMKAKISAGLNKYHAENVAWNSGIIIGRRKEYDPHYVSGFWFPHLEDACSSLNLNITQLHKWRREGFLGETKRIRKDSLEVPLYVGGFWFDSITRASHCLSLKKPAVKKRLKDNNLEESDNSSNKGKSEDGYHMTGRTGFSHPRSKAVQINGVVYGSVLEAARNTEFTKKMIDTRLKNNIPGFSWATQENI